MSSSRQQEMTLCVYFSAADESIHYPNKKNKYYPFYPLASMLKHYTLENASQIKMGFSGTGLRETAWEAIYNWRGMLFGTGIEEQCQEAYAKVMQLLMRGIKVKVICYGASRGGIAALRLAQLLGAIDAHVLEVFLVLLDPVPGNYFLTTQLDFLSLTFTKQLRDLRNCKNIKEIATFYANRPILDRYAHAPLIPAFPKKSKLTQEVIPGFHTEIQTSCPTKGCNILLISQDDDSPSNKAILEHYEKTAIETKTPIIVRKNLTFTMFGIAPHRENWDWYVLSNKEGLLDKLPFSEGVIYRHNDLFTPDLIEILKTGHACIGDIILTTSQANKYFTVASVFSVLTSWGVQFAKNLNVEFNQLVINVNNIHREKNIKVRQNNVFTFYKKIDYTLLLAYQTAKEKLIEENSSPIQSKKSQPRKTFRKNCHSFPDKKTIITSLENTDFLNAKHEKLHKQYHHVESKHQPSPMLHIADSSQKVQSSDPQKIKSNRFNAAASQQLLTTYMEEIKKSMTDQSKLGRKGSILTAYLKELESNASITTEHDLTNALRNIIALTLQRDRNCFSFFSTTTSGYAALTLLQNDRFETFKEIIFGNADPTTLHYGALREFVYGENHKADFYMRNRFFTYEICEKSNGRHTLLADHYTNFLSRSRY